MSKLHCCSEEHGCTANDCDDEDCKDCTCDCSRCDPFGEAAEKMAILRGAAPSSSQGTDTNEKGKER